MNNQQIAIKLKTILDLSEQVNDTLRYIVDQIENNPESPQIDIHGVRNMGSMQMIEEILNSRATSSSTNNFVRGLRHFYEQNDRLTESQRFHLESTYSQFRSESRDLQELF